VKLAAPIGRFISIFMLLCAGALVGGCNQSPDDSRRTPGTVNPNTNIVIFQPPLGLPPVPVPPDNPISPAKIDLGKKLFMDRRLSHNDTLSCAMCHVPEQGFTSNELGAAIGMEGRSLRRNAPTIYNVAYIEQLFHDGREFSLENQVLGPLTNQDEMANPSIGYVIEKIKIMPDYRGLFEGVFDGKGPSVVAIGQAIASYERSLLSARSPFDRWRYGGDSKALTAQEIQGLRLFTGRAQCFSCHTVGEKSALFTDNGFHNTGIGWSRTMNSNKTKYRVRLAPGVYVEVDEKSIHSNSEPIQGDVGRYEVTLNPADSWAYRTPTLRNVALTGPYMHDGSIQTLEEVVEFYDKGGIDNAGKDTRLKPLNLTSAEKSELVAFLRALTGDNVQALVKSARMAPADNPIPIKDPASEYGVHR
jgi:cytochrome c peroxidase